MFRAYRLFVRRCRPRSRPSPRSSTAIRVCCPKVACSSLADLKMDRLLDTFDEWARTHARDLHVAAPERFEPTRVPTSSRLALDLRSSEIRSIVWATGFRPDYSWLDVPVVDDKGYLRHD